MVHPVIYLPYCIWSWRLVFIFDEDARDCDNSSVREHEWVVRGGDGGISSACDALASRTYGEWLMKLVRRGVCSYRQPEWCLKQLVAWCISDRLEVLHTELAPRVHVR